MKKMKLDVDAIKLVTNNGIYFEYHKLEFKVLLKGITSEITDSSWRQIINDSFLNELLSEKINKEIEGFTFIFNEAKFKEIINENFNDCVFQFEIKINEKASKELGFNVCNTEFKKIK